MSTPTAKQAVLYRMVMPQHQCPHGLKAKDLLRRYGYQVEERLLRSRDEVEAFKAQHGVVSTPQVFIDERRIGGYDDTRTHLGIRPKRDTSYGPVIALFSVAALLALAWSQAGSQVGPQVGLSTEAVVAFIERFVAISMVLLGLQKLKDIDRFATMFLNYDLLAQRWVRYGYVYPFIETGAGLLMLAGVLTWLSAPVALLAASIGAVSVFKAVYIDQRTLKCACVGGDSRVPLGFISLSENLMMMAMALWMGSRLVL